MFRWWFEYSGGKMTDWGAHHIDIAQWALGYDHSGPVKVRGNCNFPAVVPASLDWNAFLGGETALPNGFNTAVNFNIDLEFANGAVMSVNDQYKREGWNIAFDNGILFEGDEGRIFVNRGKFEGKPIDSLTDSDKDEIDDRVIALYKGHKPQPHMENFFDSVASRQQPISDVTTHHRTMTSCHLSNISLMLGRELNWDPQAETFIGDDEAVALMSRKRRAEYDISA
jgi:predicted dehydrogenase